jgi:hypothetical protein
VEVVSITVHLPDPLAGQLTAVAARRGVAVDQVAAELVAAGLAHDTTTQDLAPAAPARRLAFAGIGSSGPGGGDIARRHRQVLAEAFAGKTARDV